MNPLSLCMIVRDAESFLPACLESVRGLVQEMVIADTGSVDGTVQIAKRAGARVLQIAWKDDFAEARNQALREARSAWILSLDADEQLDATATSRIPALLENNGVMGYQVPIRNYVLSTNERVWDQAPILNDSLLPSAAKYPAFVEHQNVRLFRRDPAIYFVGRVHESVGPRIREIHAQLGTANFCIHHFGLAVDEETKTRKNAVYREMGRKKIQESPNDWQAHFELGILELEQFKNLAGAQQLFSRACDLNPTAGIVWFFLGLTIFRMGYFEEAVNFLKQADHCGHKTALVAETRGDALYNLGQFDEARSAYEAALKRAQGTPSVEAKLGLTIVRSGKTERGLERLRAAVSACPLTPELHEGLILSLVYVNRIEEAAKAAQNKLKTVPNLLAGDYLRAASLWAQLNNWCEAMRALEHGLAGHPGDVNLHKAYREVRQAMEPQRVQVP
jgi:glycosyltransferase involved in cell wall biosynthesis